jgi:NAD(P)-dependent dehydrogenase (short-subunit alcohol dehydrogenase family)
MILAGKVAVVYGAGGSVGGAVARAFAAEGATVVLAGRTRASLEATAAVIGHSAEVAPVDALDRAAVDAHADAIVARHGRLDISFNCIGMGDAQGEHLAAMTPEKFMLPVETALRSQFYTANAASRHMAKQGSGVILMITANAAVWPHPNQGGFGVACAAMEALVRQFAVEMGPSGIRVVGIRSAGSPDAVGVSAAFDLHASIQGISREDFDRRAGEGAALRHLPSLAEVSGAAVLMVSDHARAMTAAIANVTCGQLVD